MNRTICGFKRDLVSIIVPCYNGARFLPRMLDSICKQTYTYIQLVFVNDGSVDATERVFYSYVPLFRNMGIKYSYIKQENQGQAKAVNSALPYVEGEYMMWIDSDDYLAETHVSKKIECFNAHKDASIVCCRGVMVEENNLECVIGYFNNQHMTGELFENILFERARCTNGLYMVKTEALFDVLPDKKIYPSGVGQNLQILLPISYKYKVSYLDENLFYCVVRSESHSHNIHGIPQWCRRFHEIKELKIHILQEMRKSLSEEYRSMLCRLVYLQELYQKIDMILNSEYEDEESIYIREEMVRLYRHFMRWKKERQYWIWGFYDKSWKLKYYLEKYAGVTVTGFIDSDRIKWNDLDVISPEEIDVEKMYLLILLRDHSDISKRLYTYGFQINRDFFYPEFEISNSLKNYRRNHERK